MRTLFFPKVSPEAQEALAAIQLKKRGKSRDSDVHKDFGNFILELRSTCLIYRDFDTPLKLLYQILQIANWSQKADPILSQFLQNRMLSVLLGKNKDHHCLAIKKTRINLIKNILKLATTAIIEHRFGDNVVCDLILEQSYPSLLNINPTTLESLLGSQNYQNIKTSTLQKRVTLPQQCGNNNLIICHICRKCLTSGYLRCTYRQKVSSLPIKFEKQVDLSIFLLELFTNFGYKICNRYVCEDCASHFSHKIKPSDQWKCPVCQKKCFCELCLSMYNLRKLQKKANQFKINLQPLRLNCEISEMRLGWKDQIGFMSIIVNNTLIKSFPKTLLPPPYESKIIIRSVQNWNSKQQAHKIPKINHKNSSNPLLMIKALEQFKIINPL